MKRLGGWLAAAGLLLVMPFGASAAQPSAGCAWEITATPGVSLTVTGRQFAHDTEVRVTYGRSGESPTSVIARTNGNGAFDLVIPAGPGRGGRYLITASDGDCILATEAVAVESAVQGVRSLPQTDTEPEPPAPARSPMTALAGLLAIGTIVGILVLRVGRRASR